MRIRGTKPEFWRSRTVAAVDWDARLVLKGLESYVDDNGVGKDDVELIVSDVFPRDMVREPSRTLARVSEAISLLNQAGLVWRYEVDGQPLLYMSAWESFQRIDKPGKGRLPRPDGTTEYGQSVIRECDATSCEPSRALAPVTGEQGNRGTESGAVPDESEDATPEPAESKAKSNRRAPALPLPADWEPKDRHREAARTKGVDIDVEVASFRFHADANDRRQARWDSTFDQWLVKARVTPENSIRKPSGDTWTTKEPEWKP